MKLESYNKIIWAILGTGAIAVVALGVIASIFSFSFSHQNNSIVVGERKPKEAVEKVLVYYNPIICDFSEFVMIPVGFQNVSRSKLSRIGSFSSYRSGRSYGVSGSYYEFDGPFNNIIFKNKNTDEAFLLLDKPAMITSFYYPYKSSEDKNASVAKFLMFTILEKDSNKDGLINDDDADSVYISNMTGKNLKKVNPENTKLIDWNLSEKDKKLYLRLRTDSNRDNKFTEEDKMEIIVVNPENLDIKPEPLISEKIKSKIEEILSK